MGQKGPDGFQGLHNGFKSCLSEGMLSPPSLNPNTNKMVCMQVCMHVTLSKLMPDEWMCEWHDSLNCNVGSRKKNWPSQTRP